MTPRMAAFLPDLAAMGLAVLPAMPSLMLAATTVGLMTRAMLLALQVIVLPVANLVPRRHMPAVHQAAGATIALQADDRRDIRVCLLMADRPGVMIAPLAPVLRLAGAGGADHDHCRQE